MNLRDSSAIVTGGAGGFGSATARRFAAAGAKVIIADVHDERGEALAKELGNGCKYVNTNVLDEKSVEAAIKAAVDLAPLRAAVVVHGGPPAPGSKGPQRIVNREGERLPLSQFAHSINVHLISPFAVLSQAAEQMAKNEPQDSGQRGAAVLTASIAGFEGQTGQSPYSAAKGGIIGMTLVAARDLAPLGIRVVTIAPGTFLTFAYSARMTNEEAQAKWSPSIPNPKRMGDPDEYARLALHIVENDFLNGTTIRLDGAQRF